MFFTLDRIEDGNIAVLIDENGKKLDIPVVELPEQQRIGNVYDYIDNVFIYNEKETLKRKEISSEKLKKLLSKAKKQ